MKKYENKKAVVTGGTHGMGAGDRQGAPRRRSRILATGAGDARGYEKHVYRDAFAAQIERSIFEYCGLRDIQTHLFLDIENADGLAREANLRTSFELGKNLFSTGPTPSHRDRHPRFDITTPPSTTILQSTKST